MVMDCGACGWPMGTWWLVTLMAFMTLLIDFCPLFKTILYDSNQQGRTLPSTPYPRGLLQHPIDNRHNGKFRECRKHLREAAVQDDFEVTLFNYLIVNSLKSLFLPPFYCEVVFNNFILTIKLGSEVVLLLTKPLVSPNFSVDSKCDIYQHDTPAQIKYSKC